MVRLKQTFPETAQLLLTGPKSLLAESQVVEARLNLTWYELLTGELQMKVDKNSGIFVCTSRFCPSSPKDGEGWRAEIHEKISEFVSKFERKRRQYTVRFCHPNDISTYQETHTHGATSENGIPSTPKSKPEQRRRTRAPTPGPSGPKLSSSSARTRSSTPTSSTTHRRPNIVIPTTQGAAPRTRASTPSPAQNGNYQKPRYYSANGLPHSTDSSPQRNQQLHYGTRLKRRHEQTLEQTGTTTGAGVSGRRNGVPSPAKQQRFENARRSNINSGSSSSSSSSNLPSVIQRHQLQQQQLQQRQMGTREGVTTRQAAVKTDPDTPIFPIIENVRSIITSAVKMELQPLDDDEDEEEEEVEGEEEEWSRNWDDYEEPQQQVNGNRNGVAGRDTAAEVNLASDSEEDDDDDMLDDASLCTAATQEANELRTEGINMEDVKSLVETRITRFSNAYMLRVKNEIRKLRQNNLWDRNVNRSPLACYLLTELFKE